MIQSLPFGTCLYLKPLERGKTSKRWQKRKKKSSMIYYCSSFEKVHCLPNWGASTLGGEDFHSISLVMFLLPIMCIEVTICSDSDREEESEGLMKRLYWGNSFGEHSEISRNPGQLPFSIEEFFVSQKNKTKQKTLTKQKTQSGTFQSASLIKSAGAHLLLPYRDEHCNIVIMQYLSMQRLAAGDNGGWQEEAWGWRW